MDQAQKNLEYLNHCLRNGTCKLKDCMREMEEILRAMNEAVKVYLDMLKDECDGA